MKFPEILHVHRDESHLFYIGHRSPDTRFVVVGIHNIRRGVWWPCKMLELTYYQRDSRKRTPFRRLGLPRYKHWGPFMDIKFWRGHLWELDIGWRHRSVFT